MKRIIVIALILLLVTQSVIAVATDTTILIPSTLTRDIALSGKIADGSFGSNPIVPGISPTTGLPVTGSRYFPVLVQIDNNLASLPQWGIGSADIMYELPVQGGGWTRLTALYSDQYPDETGPVRSARMMHADLREEWDALFLYYGEQDIKGSDFSQAIRTYGAAVKGLIIDGIGNKYSEYFQRVRFYAAPHNVSALVRELVDLVSQNGYEIEQRPFKFTESKNYFGPDAVRTNILHKENEDSRSSFLYDVNKNYYLRFTGRGIYTDLMAPETPLNYSNVIIQRTRLSFNQSSLAPLLPDIVGSGAADIFIGGKYIAGAWARTTAQSRTVFFDQNGKELELQRGRTWIVITNEDTAVSFESAYDADTAAYYQSTGKLPLYKTLKLGDRGDEVRDLKQRLFELGFLGSSKFNNQYQESTAEAVRQFETRNGLPVDGIADSLVLELIFQGVNPTVIHNELPAEDIAAQQVEIIEPEIPTAEEVLPETIIVNETDITISNDENTVESEIDEGISKTTDNIQTSNSSIEEQTAIVRTGNNGMLNMRQSADKSGTLLERIPNNSLVKVLEKGEEWTRILNNGQEGFVMTSFLVFQNLDTSEMHYKTLKVGDSGPEVTLLKQRFYELGYYRGSSFNDQYMENTADTVRRFEKRNGLPVDGVADNEMQMLLFSSDAKRP